MEDLIKILVEPLVTDAGTIKITSEKNQDQIKFTLSVPQTDIAKVIGRGGKMIKAIKNLLKIRAIKENVFVELEVKEA